MILRGDCRASMAAMADASIDSIVTDPPYELGLAGRAWDRSGIAYDVGMWRQALRVLKPGGWLVAFSSPRTYHRMACAIEDAGFEIRDQLMWIYGQGAPKSRDAHLKPAHEPIVLARRPFRGSLVTNRARFGTGTLNIDACRIVGATARWPANILHDGSDEVVAAFPTTKSGRVAQGSVVRAKNKRVFGAFAERELPARAADVGSAARFFYCSKATKVDRHEGCEDIVTIVDGKPVRGNIHITVKPVELMRWLVRLVTPIGGTILDPFAGSGSTGKAAVLQGFSFIGCELDHDHAVIAEARIAAATARVDQQKLAA